MMTQHKQAVRMNSKTKEKKRGQIGLNPKRSLYFKTRVCRVQQKLTQQSQVGTLSRSLRFQRLLGGGTKTVRGRRPASRYKKSGFP